MPLSFVSGLSKAFAFAGGKKTPETVKFPANCLIPYYGDRTDPALYDWENYTLANGHYILGTTTQSQIGVTYPAAVGGFNASGTTSSAGSHTGNAVTQNWIGSTGSPFISQHGGAPTHSHTYSGSSYDSTDSMLNRQNINLLRSKRSTTHLPANALVIRENAPNNSVAFSTTGNSYLCGSDNVLSYRTGTPYNFSIGLNVGYNSGHDHTSSATAYRQFATGAYIRNYNMGMSGAHTHSASATFTQSIINSKLVNLWQLTERSFPKPDLIVMYVGTILDLPTSWKLCDGLNGTPNLGGYVIGYRNNAWNITTASNAYVALSSTDSPYVPHSHSYSYARTPNSAGPTAYHSNYGWLHSHTLSNYYISNYLPQRIGVAFIQYKG